MDAWRQKWHELNTRGHAYDKDAICWVDYAPSNDLDPVVPPGRVCAALVSTHHSKLHEAPILPAVLAAGIPVVLWHRASSGRQNRRKALEQVLRGRPLRELPDVVFQQRRAAHDPKAAHDHAGRDLVLLWDDPDRVPAELDLHPPTLATLLEGAAP